MYNRIIILFFILVFSFSNLKSQTIFIQANYPLLFSNLKGIAAVEPGFLYWFKGKSIGVSLSATYTACKGLENENLRGLGGGIVGLYYEKELNASMGTFLFIKGGYTALQNSVVEGTGFYGETGFNLYHANISSNICLNLTYRRFWISDINYTGGKTINGNFGALLIGVFAKLRL